MPEDKPLGERVAALEATYPILCDKIDTLTQRVNIIINDHQHRLAGIETSNKWVWKVTTLLFGGGLFMSLLKILQVI